MIWQLARVVESDSGRLSLVFSTPSTCRRCADGRGCGAGSLAGLFMRSSTAVILSDTVNARRGEWVRVGIEPVRLATAATIHYGLPLLLFLAGAAVGHALAADETVRDVAALLGGLLALLVGVPLLRRHAPVALNPEVERLSCEAGDTNSSHI